MQKQYDIVLFGVTGFTGKLAAEHILVKSYPIRFAVCGRNETKVKSVMSSILETVGRTNMPAVEVCDLTSTSPEEEEKLRAIVRKTKVVLTTAGPFEKFGTRLVKVCAEEGVHYADITGESDFFRKMIEEHDATAARTGANVIMHCGNDCIPWDLTVFEMSKFAQSLGCELFELKTYTEVPDATAASGGTLATAVYQLGKKRSGAKQDVDPLLLNRDRVKSDFTTQVNNPKADVFVPQFKCYGGPWIMGPVMGNCVRRSNALLGYHKNLVYSDLMLRGNPTWSKYLGEKAFTALVAAAVVLPSVFQRFLPGPGEGPSREAMEAGWLNVYAEGKMVHKQSGEVKQFKSRYHFDGDCGYLNTAKMLVETGMVLLQKTGSGGVSTPAAAMGSDIVERLATELGAQLEIKLVTNEQ